MYEVILESKEGYQLHFNQIGGAYSIKAIEGLSPAAALINTNENALIDGATFNSSKVNMRTLNIAFSIDKDPEQSRIAAYKVLRPKEPVRMYYVSNARDVFIDGYVQSVNVTHFEAKQALTVMIVCPAPFFKKAQEIINYISAVTPAFHFPFSSTAEPQIIFGMISDVPSVTVVNDGAVDTGLTFEIYASGNVSDPKIYNYKTQEFFGLDIDLVAGDLVTIKTGQGEKTAVLLREGVESNVFNLIVEGSTWLQRPAGGAKFIYTIESGLENQIDITVRHFDLYEGV